MHFQDKVQMLVRSWERRNRSQTKQTGRSPASQAGAGGAGVLRAWDVEEFPSNGKTEYGRKWWLTRRTTDIP